MTTGTSGSQLGNITITDPISWSGSAGGGTSLTLNAANQILLNANISATDSNSSVNFVSPVVVGVNATVTAGNQIFFSSTIDDTVSGQDSLTLAAGTVNLMENVGATKPLHSLTITDASGGGSGLVTIGNSSSSSPQTISITATNSITIDSGIQDAVSGGGIESLTLQSHVNTLNGDIGGDGAFGLATNPLVNLTLSDALGGGTGSDVLGMSNISTTGDQTYNDAVTFNSGSLSLSAANVHFNNTTGFSNPNGNLSLSFILSGTTSNINAGQSSSPNGEIGRWNNPGQRYHAIKYRPLSRSESLSDRQRHSNVGTFRSA